ncbi:hypothetical protein GCM10009654_39590 [Streptomyces hebeiensis]|uniref:Uncharacterized protein n=1 Tax=Streptomyces hebeiensis TaxID=229486 RepID=A0ABN1V0H1_9ACTN
MHAVADLASAQARPAQGHRLFPEVLEVRVLAVDGSHGAILIRNTIERAEWVRYSPVRAIDTCSGRVMAFSVLWLSPFVAWRSPENESRAPLGWET